MRMMRRLLSLCLALLCTSVAAAHAHGAQEHGRQMELVLFGAPNHSLSLDAEQQHRVAMLKHASYLCLDQFNHNGQQQLDYLRRSMPSLLPGGIESIDFTDGRHRSYTHRGWDFVYGQDERADKAKWPLRRELLLKVTNKVFGFQRLSGSWLGIDFGHHKQCNSFSALLYYVHILGDHLADADFRVTGELKMPLARAHAGKQNPDVFFEFQQHLPVLFESQKDTRSYRALMQGIDALAEDARALAATSGGIDSAEKFERHQSLANELLQVLSDYVPMLLKKEAYFQAAFPG